MPKDKKVMQVNQEAKKTFGYELNGVSISFNLRTDVKTELVAAKAILERAIEDFDKEPIMQKK